MLKLSDYCADAAFLNMVHMYKRVLGAKGFPQGVFAWPPTEWVTEYHDRGRKRKDSEPTVEGNDAPPVKSRRLSCKTGPSVPAAEGKDKPPAKNRPSSSGSSSSSLPAKRSSTLAQSSSSTALERPCMLRDCSSSVLPNRGCQLGESDVPVSVPLSLEGKWALDSRR